MRKVWILVLLVGLFSMVSGCESKTEFITMMVPYGSPQLTQLHIQDNPLYQVDIIQGSDPLMVAFASGSHDVIFAPVNLGAKLYQTGAPYVLLAVVTWGNLYLVSIDQSLEDIQDIESQTIVAFGRNQPPDIVLRHILTASSIETDLIYVDSVASATAYLVSTPGSIVLVAEPSLSVLMAQYPQLHTLDLQSIYETIEGKSSYPQAAVFVKTNMDDPTKSRISSDLEQSINLVNDKPEEAAVLAIRLGIDTSQAILVQAIPRSHLRYGHASDARLDVLSFLTIFNVLEPAIFNGWLPDDGFFDV